MLGRLDRLVSLVSLRTVILASPAVFLLHDLEELLTMERFLRENRESLPIPAALKDRLNTTTGQFAVAIAWPFPICAAVSSMAAKSLVPGAVTHAFAVMICGRFLNALTHVGQSLLFRKRSPGLISAVFVVLPYSAYTLRRLQKAGLVGERELPRMMAEGGLLMGAAIPCALAVGRMAVRMAGR
ncbi:MAG TPA: HXXEE domain-containing protein [Chloroflexota bacterium]|nr:HXXEE domain-containing protein [Chloroflexota bacterium]